MQPTGQPPQETRFPKIPLKNCGAASSSLSKFDSRRFSKGTPEIFFSTVKLRKVPNCESSRYPFRLFINERKTSLYRRSFSTNSPFVPETTNPLRFFWAKARPNPPRGKEKNSSRSR